MSYQSKLFRRRVKSQTLTFLLWASLYVFVMEMTIFKSNVERPAKTFPTSHDNNTKGLIQDPECKAENDQMVVDNLAWKEPDNATLAELQSRVERVHETCHNRSLYGQTVQSKEFFVDNEHSLVWCNIFKAASSSWMYNFNILGGYDKKFLLRTRQLPLMLARKKFPRPSEDEVLDAVNTPGVVSFMIVREPFVRLLSAYRDKLEGDSLVYYNTIKKTIISRHRKRAIRRIGPIKSTRPTFYEFVSYLIENYKNSKKNGAQLSMDEHWAPYYKFCTPCAVNFTVIAKVETLDRDSAYIVNTLGLGHTLHRKVSHRRARLRVKKIKQYSLNIANAARDGKNTTALVKDYFSQIDEKMLSDLLEIYGADFEMFGYDPKVYYGYVKKNKEFIQFYAFIFHLRFLDSTFI